MPTPFPIHGLPVGRDADTSHKPHLNNDLLPLTPKKLAQLKWKPTMHCNFGRQNHGYILTAVTFPELSVSIMPIDRRIPQSPKRRCFVVGDEEIPWGQLERVCEAVNKFRGCDEPNG